MKEIGAKEFDARFESGETVMGSLELSSARRTNQSRLLSPKITGVKAVLFDCDGVLCPPMRFADLLEREHQITREMTAEFFRSAFLPALLGKADVLTLLPPYLEQWKWRDSPERFLDVWLSSERELRSEVIKIVNELRGAGYFVGVATNQEPRRAKYLRAEMGFDQLFDKCFISSELGCMKPQPEYFREVAKKIGAEPDQIIFIDDQQNYLDAASASGWQTILFNDAQDAHNRIAELLERAASSKDVSELK